MAEDLYEQYAGLLDQQVDLAEKTVIGIVRAAFGDFSVNFKRHLRSLVPLRRPPITNGYPSGHMTHAEEEIESARDAAQRQIATALANGFGALAHLPSALGTLSNQPSVPSLSGSSNPATVGAIDTIAGSNYADISDDDSMSIKSEDTSECESDFESHSEGETEIKEEATEEDANEMPVTAGTSNVNSNNDTVSVKTEIESECDSSDSESSNEEEEFTAGREIKEEIDDAHSNDQIMGNSDNEDGSLQVVEEEQQEENETQSNDDTIDSNFERSDAMMIENDEASNEGDDEPTIIVVNYEEFEMQSRGILSNQDTVAEGSGNEESVNIAEPDGEFDDNVETTNSYEDAGVSQSEAVITEAISEQDQSGPPTVLNPSPTLIHRSTPAPRAVNYAEGMENSLLNQEGTSTGTRKGNVKRKIGPSAKSNAPKRSRIVPAPAIAAHLQNQVNDDSEDEEDPESEAISFRVIIRRLNCRVLGCKKVFSSQMQLDGHLLTKHAIEKYACKVKDCTESYATWGELTTHRNSAHDNLDNEWPCGQCEVICNNYKDLYVHINHYHEYGLFSCSADKCDFTEKTRIKVKNHQLKHRPAKYRCTYAGCSSSFKLKSHLTTHLRVHSKEKPFLCSQCPKAFAQKSHLTAHERVHSGLKPYSCTWPHCDFSTSRHSSVILHIRGVHFGLPRSMKKQKERGIIDNRDARPFVKKSNTTVN